jgi:alpha-glucosidase
MHSWKPDGWITEPWSYTGRLAAVRHFIRERYRFLPYIYDLAIRAAETGIPMESPLALEFPGDLALTYESLDRMAGDAILVPSPPQRGKAWSLIHLPACVDWFDPEAGKLIRGGTDYEFEYRLDSVRYFFRCGAVVPTAASIAATGKSALKDYRFEILPPIEGSIACIHSEDDGESDFTPGSHWRYRMECAYLGGKQYRFNASREEVAIDRDFHRTWRFHVPSGFIILDGKDMSLGEEVEFSLDAAPDKIEFLVEGAYLQDARS